jgi:hypothetical protein
VHAAGLAVKTLVRLQGLQRGSRKLVCRRLVFGARRGALNRKNNPIY